MESKLDTPSKKHASIVSAGVLCGFVLFFLTSSQPIAGSEDEFIPLICTADTTVGLHDAFDEEEATERYEPRLFNKSEFKLTENRTFQELLADEDVDLYLTLQDVKTEISFEYSCRKIRGWGQSHGYSCVNSPPTEMLAVDPTTLRFSRASVGAWTFYTAEDLNDSAVLFIEKGSCVRDSSTHSQDETDEQSN